jgi:cleavage and polyadenylation specificity factor subunit 3
MLFVTTESSKQHAHSHGESLDQEKSIANLSHRFKQPHPHRTPDPATRLARLCLFLEAQFGEDSVSPIALPRHSTTGTSPDPTSTSTAAPDTYSVAASPDSVTPSTEFSPEDKAELKRLHNLGIPVPGIEVKFDKYVARIWLEDLEVECKSGALRARVKAVVERGVETVSGLWS